MKIGEILKRKFNCFHPNINSLMNIFSVAKVFGSLAQLNLTFVMIPVTKSSVLLHVFRVSFENVNFFHRWLGRWVSILLLHIK